MGGDSGFHPFYNKLSIETVARKGAETATELLGATSCETFKRPAIIRNSVVADLIDFLSSSLNGEEIYKGKSLLKGRIGQKVFHSDFNLVDDATLEGGYSTRPFDGEGNAAQKTLLIREGVYESCLTDRLYARKLGVACTANASRSIKAPPMITQTNLILEKGTLSFSELLKQAHHGILITDLMGVHTANPVTGNFSLGASGILIENGKLTRPVRGFAVAGNVLDLFKNFSHLGSDLEFFGNTGTPSILLPELSISGS
jgi:PmbA protein